jgi:CRP-like cAMP-binding protein
MVQPGGSFRGADVSNPSLRTAKSNRILGALPQRALERLIPDLCVKPLELKQVLQARGVPVEQVVFPIHGVASMISVGDNGGSIEVATIGCEGIVGLPLFLGGVSAAGEVFIQVAGKGLYMGAADFHRHVAAEPLLVRILLRYTQALLTQVAQCSACNRHHSTLERCARWLSQTRDRVRGDEFSLTHDFLSLMLGVRRATVSETAQALQAQGLIQYHRGVIRVTDRAGLEAASCECYRQINREYARLLKPDRTQ